MPEFIKQSKNPFSLKQTSKTVLLASTLSLLASCNSNETTGYVKISGSTMGTTYSVIIESDKALAEQLQTEIEVELNTINQLMSTYIPDSEINRFNRHVESSCFSFSKPTWTVLLAAQQIYQETDGAFDITVGPLISRWGFNVEQYDERVPSQQEIDTLLAQTGTDKLRFDYANRCISKSIPNMTINLSAIAKGYAVDQLAEITSTFDINNYLVEIGGETKGRGHNPNQQLWRLAVEDPASSTRQQAKIVNLENSSIATSGDYRIYFTHNGKRFSHTISPSTGYPITHNLASVSVIHPSNMMADAYATAFSVMGSEQAHRFAVENNIALFTISREKDKLVSKANNLFELSASQ